jgi:hypothetical protein
VKCVTSSDEIIKNVVGNQAGLQNYLNELLIFDAKNLRQLKEMHCNKAKRGITALWINYLVNATIPSVKPARAAAPPAIAPAVSQLS